MLWYTLVCLLQFGTMDSQHIWKEPCPKHPFKRVPDKLVGCSGFSKAFVGLSGMWSDESRGFVDDVNGFNFVDAWPMIIVIPCVEIHFEPRFSLVSRWAPYYECHPPNSKISDPGSTSLETVGRCAVFKFATGIKIHSKISNPTWYTIPAADILTKFWYKPSSTFSFPSRLAVVN